MDTISPSPSLKRHWRALLVCMILAYAIGLGVRMIDLPKWDDPNLRVKGEYIQGTHDAYHWLAGAEGFGSGQGHPLAVMARLGKELLGIQPGNFGFFCPAVVAALVGGACVLLAWTLGGMEAGIIAAAMAVASPGFYYRTRLGYYDTDMVTLLFPLLLCWAVAHLSRPYLFESWLGGFRALRRKAPRTAKTPLPGALYPFLMALTGCFAWYCVTWHPKIAMFEKLLYSMACVLFLLLSLPGMRGRLLFGLTAFGLAAFLGVYGVLAACALLLCATFLPRLYGRMARTPWLGLILALAVLAQAGVAQSLLRGGDWLLSTYGKPVAEEQANTTAGASKNTMGENTAKAAIPEKQRVVYPAVVQSVVEAQNVSALKLLLRLHIWPAVTVAGLLGFFLVVGLRPLAVFLVPLLILAISAVGLGGRMTMFGSPLAGLGLGLPLVWLAQMVLARISAHWRTPVLTGGALVLAIAATMPALSLYARLDPTPVLTKAHCEALLDLRNKTPEDAMIWTWWDWGYATHYYARRNTFADGGRHKGEPLYPLALVFTTPSRQQASQLIKFCAIKDYKPWEIWNNHTSQEVHDFLSGLGGMDFRIRPKQKQYLVVTLENFTLLHWISFYGSWDVTSRQGVHARVVAIKETFDVDYDKGHVDFPESATDFSLKTIDVILDGRLNHHEFPKNKGYHLIVSSDTREYFLMDDMAYDSQTLRLLFADPENSVISRYFKLVHEGFPNVRVYEVR